MENKLLIYIGFALVSIIVGIIIRINKFKQLKADVLPKQIKSFQNLLFKFSYAKTGTLSGSYGLGSKAKSVDVYFTRNQMVVLPSNFSIFGSYPLPLEINKRLEDLNFEYQSDSIIVYYTNENYGEKIVKGKFFLKGSQMQLGELKQYLETWLHDI